MLAENRRFLLRPPDKVLTEGFLTGEEQVDVRNATVFMVLNEGCRNWTVSSDPD